MSDLLAENPSLRSILGEAAEDEVRLTSDQARRGELTRHPQKRFRFHPPETRSTAGLGFRIVRVSAAGIIL